MPLQPGNRLGHYEVLSALGAGGMGEVWRARDSRLGREVALKVLPAAFVADPERLARFEREAKVLASLNHPHIGGIHGLEETDGVKALVLELVEGPTLADRISRGPISLDEALPIARQIAEALEAAHEQGIIHRDLKPANIKVRPDGTVKVLDFGLAKALQPQLQGAQDDVSHSPTLTLGAAATQMGMILGTAAYMAPEQARGKRVDKRADLWAFGCVLYEMLTGKRAFAGDNVTDTLASVVRAEPDWSALPADTPSLTRRLLRRCLEKDPRERLRDAGDARQELADSLEASPTTALPKRVARRWRWSLAAVMLAVVTLIAAFAASGWRVSRERPVASWRGERLGGPGTAFGPRVSPDGQMLAFEAFVDGLTQVGIMHLGSGQWTILTDDRSRGLVVSVAWAPDGSSVYFDRFLDEPGGVFRVPALGGEPRLVLDDAMTPEPLGDGSLIVLRLNEKGQTQLFRFRPETGSLDALNGVESPTILEPAVRASPDGREVLFYGRPVDREANRDDLYGIDLESGKVRLVVATQPSGDWLWPLAVTRDGAEVLMNAASGDLHRIVAVPFSGSGATRALFELTNRSQGMDTGADGAIYTDLIDQPVEILILDETGRRSNRIAVSNVSTTATNDVLPLPDGRILITMQVAGRDRVMALLADGSVSTLFETKEETRGPMALVGRETVALVLGSPPRQVLALASTRDGRIERRLEAIEGSTVRSLAGAPDGRTLYYSAGGHISEVSLETGVSKVLHAGDAVAVDPAGRYIVAAVPQRGGRQLVKVVLDDGVAEEIPIRSEVKLADMSLASNAVGPDGRIAVRIAPRDSWFWSVGILDPSTGTIERAWPDVAADMWAGWADDGRLVAAAWRTNSSLWRFIPETH